FGIPQSDGDAGPLDPSPVFASLQHLARGKLLFQRGQIGQAREEWLRALEKNPSIDLRATFLAGIGGTYWKQGNDDEALRYFTQAVSVAETTIEDVRAEELLAGYLGSYRRWFYEMVIEL